MGCVILWSFVLVIEISFAGPRIEIGSSPNPVGSGARAIGMGGAFIAVADDATAASWNPGGLIQLETPEISVVIDHQDRQESISFESNPESDGRETVTIESLNYLSAAYPFQIGTRNMIVSLNYQRLYDFNRHWKFEIDAGSNTISDIDYKQEGALYALGLAYAAMITKNMSVGFTLNYWGDAVYENGWEQTYSETTTVTFPMFPSVQIQLFDKYLEEYAFSGSNANLGFLYNFSEKWTLGGVVKLPFAADLEHRSFKNDELLNTSDDELDMPLSYGIGLAYRYSDAFTVSADIYRTHWEDFIYRTASGVESSPVSDKAISESDIDPTTWVRLGAEYLYIGNKVVIPFRAGVFYDPAPAERSPDRYLGFALGSGIAYKNFVWDIAYQFRYGDDVGRSMLQNYGFSQDTTEHNIYTSVIFHF